MDRKAEVWKYILLIVAVAGQIIGFLFLFINVVAAFIFLRFLYSNFYYVTPAVYMGSEKGKRQRRI